MTNQEIFDALIADRPKLLIKARSFVSRASKQLKKENNFPAWKWVEYIHQESHNRYLITCYAPTLEKVDNPFVKYITFFEEDHKRVVIECGYWPYRKHGTLEKQRMRAICYYYPHFFQRYRERVLNNQDVSYYDLLCRYVWRNIASIPIEMNEKIQRNYKEYGEFGAVSFQQSEGVCFVRHWCEGDELTIGSKQDNYLGVVHYLTIVTNDMMSDIQKKAIGAEGQRYMLNQVRHLMEDAMKDPFFRQLNSKN